MGGAGLLLGRDRELHQIGSLLGRARNGRGGALLLSGEPGIGKTTLLEASTAAPVGMSALRVDGFESESQIPFAAVQRLIIPLRGLIPTLPGWHQQALHIAAGDAAGPPPDRFLVGLGVLGLIARASETAPVVCAVDDSHLLDPESLDALAFVARRVAAERAALVFAARDQAQVAGQLAGIPVLPVPGLGTDAAVELLQHSLTGDLDPSVAAQIALATGGNPLALTDLASELSVKQLTESSFGDEPVPVGRHLEAFYLRQVRRLDADQQLWVLVVAAESTGNVDLITAAATELGLRPSAPGDVEAAGLVDLGATVRFRHPLVRAAAYTAAHGRDRLRVHAALSAVADATGLREHAAWHAAKSTLGSSEEVARRLSDVADLAGRRGGYTSKANVLARASGLTPPGPARCQRLVAAAEAALAAGRGTLAKSLLDEVDDDALDPVSRARLLVLSAQLALFAGDRAFTRGCADLLDAAEIFHGHDRRLEQDTLIRAWDFLLPTETSVEGTTVEELGRRLAAGATVSDGVAGTVLAGLAALVLRPFAEAVPVMQRAVEAIATLEIDECLAYGPSSVALTTALWDNEQRDHCLRRTAEAARDLGSLQLLDSALWVLSMAETLGGTPRRAAQYVEQVRELRRGIGFDAEHVTNVALLSWLDVARDEVVALAEGAASMGFTGVRSASLRVVAIVDLARARYDLAHGLLAPLVREPFVHVGPISYPDFVEAAVRTGRVEETTTVLADLEHRASVTGSPWALGVAARSRALVSDDATAEGHYTAAIAHLTGNRAEVDLARAHLLYGEWLRRVRRRGAAREQLRRAAEVFRRAGADVFLPRVDAELAATGADPRRPAGSHGLTHQELTVAELAAAGRTNAEIGAAMFLSSNTVDYHLRKVFQKLGVSSRRQLSDRLARERPPVV